MGRTGRGLRVAVLAVVVLGIGLLVWSTNRPDWEATSIVGVVAASDSDTVAVTFLHGSCRRDPRVVVVEQSAEVVRLRAEEDVGGDCDSVGITSEVDVTLDAELGARRIELEQWTSADGPTFCEIDGEPADRCTSVQSAP